MKKFSLANGYMPYPALSTSILSGLMTQKVSSPRSYTVVAPNGGEMRRNRTQIRLAAAPPPDAKTYMSQQASSSFEDNQPLGQPLPTISAPMTPTPNQRQSPQQDSKGPRQTYNPVPAVQNRHTDSRLHKTIQQQPRASNETSVNSEAGSTNTPDKDSLWQSCKSISSPGSVRDLADSNVWSKRDID